MNLNQIHDLRIPKTTTLMTATTPPIMESMLGFMPSMREDKGMRRIGVSATTGRTNAVGVVRRAH